MPTGAARDGTGQAGAMEVEGPSRRRRPEPTPVARAIGLLSRREHSARELRLKLQARGLAPEEAAAAVAKVGEAGWQDDARFAEMLVRSRAEQGYGPRRIAAELKMHGLGEDLVAAALHEAGQDWPALARRLAQRRYGPLFASDPTAARKAAELLYRRGFDGDQVRRACDAVEDAEATWMAD